MLALVLVIVSTLFLVVAFAASEYEITQLRRRMEKTMPKDDLEDGTPIAETRAAYLPFNSPCLKCGSAAAAEYRNEHGEEFIRRTCRCGFFWNEPTKEQHEARRRDAFRKLHNTDLADGNKVPTKP